MAKTKVLILHTSVGYGIKATAVNIAEKLEISGEYEIRVEDVQKIMGGRSSQGVEKLYMMIMDKFSFIWGFLYSSRFVMWIMLPLRKPLASFKSKNVLALLRDFQPAIVISTQTVSTGVIAYLKAKGLYHGKLVAVFSDFHTHPFWIYPEVDLYLCAIAQQEVDLVRLGIPKDRIAVTGIILAEKFNQQIPREEALAQAQLLTSMPVVLLFNGGRPRLAVQNIFLRLLRSPKSFQIVVVCGLNQELKTLLEQISPPDPHPVKILGYANNVDVLMAAADVMVGKTGGPTMGEAIKEKLPIILTDINPGHEEANLKYLVNNGIAQYARNPAEATFFVEQILAGKLKKDWPHAENLLIHPNDVISVIEAINKINIQPKIKHYQENEPV